MSSLSATYGGQLKNVNLKKVHSNSNTNVILTLSYKSS